LGLNPLVKNGENQDLQIYGIYRSYEGFQRKIMKVFLTIFSSDFFDEKEKNKG